jgi:5-methylcytosine-specific restriction enzyme A
MGILRKKTRRISIPREVRVFVFNRDRNQCQSCHCIFSEAKLNVDHIIPIALGGSNDLSNLQTLCRRCNNKKKHRIDPRFKRRFS